MDELTVSRDAEGLAVIIQGWIKATDEDDLLSPLDVVKGLQCSSLDVTWETVVEKVETYERACSIVANIIFKEKAPVSWHLSLEKSGYSKLTMGRVDGGIVSFLESNLTGEKTAIKKKLATQEVNRITGEYPSV